MFLITRPGRKEEEEVEQVSAVYFFYFVFVLSFGWGRKEQEIYRTGSLPVLR